KRNAPQSGVKSSQSSEGEVCFVDETDGISTAHSGSDDDLKEFDLFKKRSHSKDKGKRKVVKPIIIDSDAESTSGNQSSMAESSKAK
ncbi:7771_t:CDS:1, partial [Acaulospora colombiana]